MNSINQRLANIEEKLDSLSAKISNPSKQVPTELLAELVSLRKKNTRISKIKKR
jgi:hypothetical protein